MHFEATNRPRLAPSEPDHADMSPEELVRRDLDVIWHPCAQMADYRDFPPLPVVGARGCRLLLADGREILDAISSWWCKSLGHGHPAVVGAIRAQAERFEHVILANTTNEPIVAFAEQLLLAAAPPASSLQPPAFSKVFFADNGSTAVEVALKMALHWHQLRGQSQRTRYATLANGYHGETVGALSVSDLGLYADPYRPLLFPTLTVDGLPYRSGPEDPAWLDASAEWPAIERQLAPQADELAAIIYEPVLQGAGGMRVLSPDLLPRLRAWADAHGVLLIADEVASGMGRCGAMLASHLAPGGRPDDHTIMPSDDRTTGRPDDRTTMRSHGLPDLAVVSKGLTGGSLPLACVLTTQAIYDAVHGTWASRRAFLHSNTYAGNALAVAAASAVLRVFAAEGVCAQAIATGTRMRRALAGLAATRPWLTGVRGVGMVAAVDLRARDGAPLDPAARTGYRAYREAVRRGALLRPLGDTLYLFPPLTAPWSEVEAMLGILADSADAVTA
jgi:adenosylmethionine-8-amino-7-oxononanoate aminotransferase